MPYVEQRVEEGNQHMEDASWRMKRGSKDIGGLSNATEKRIIAMESVRSFL